MLHENIHKTPGDTEWFLHDRFGMFIHFGLYALPARHEWVKSYEKIPEAQYDTYFRHFAPDLYHPQEWARRAKAAGMKYAVLTTKHHEGFCLFDTQYTDYKATNTPAGRDLVREYVDAFRAEGLKIGFYYSLLDWHHPDFTIDMLHPRRDDPDALQKNEQKDFRRYAKYMRDQIRELLTQYGKVDILWLDYSYSKLKDPAYPQFRGKGRQDWEAEALIALARELQPGIVINNRTELEQDLWTPEQYQPQEWIRHETTQELVPWEACQTLSGSWGYDRDEMSWKSPEMLLGMLIDTVSLGGNLILNVGPTARGEFDGRACKALDVYADWMRVNSRSIYGCTMAQEAFEAPGGCRFTQSEDGGRLYLHLLRYPFASVTLPHLAGQVEYAQFLHDASEVRREAQKDGSLVLRLPAVKPPVLVPVIELFLRKGQ